MKKEELERLETAQKMQDSIERFRKLVKNFEELASKDITKVVLFVNCGHSEQLSIGLQKDVAVDAMQTLLEKYKQKLEKLEKQFDDF